MKDLLPHFERELILLRQRAAEFAAQFPGPASRLEIFRNTCGDPHIERLIQATALLTARVNKSLEDGYSRFTESFLEVLFPHYLRPFPSCAVVQATGASDASGLVIHRGTELSTRPVEGVACRFKTCYSIQQLPVRLAKACFDQTPSIPPSVRMPEGGAILSIDIETTHPESGFAALAGSALRVYLNGNTSLVALVRDILLGQVDSAYLATEQGEWRQLPSVPLAPVGFADEEALIPFSPRSHPAYRLLTEYFIFPEKFNFFDIDLAAIVPHVPERCQRVTLHLLLTGVLADSREAGLLSTLSASSLLLGCSPVVNLFRQSAVPILVTHERTSYPLLPDAEHVQAYDIHSIDTVRMLARRELDIAITEFRPFYSLHHGEGADKRGHYYVVRREAQFGAGHEYQIAFVDDDFDPASCDQATVSVELTCSNDDLPQRLECGSKEGDLLKPADWPIGIVKFVRRPTAPQRFAATPALQWRLLSHLTLNYRSLAREGLAGLREMLSLYDLAQTSTTKGQIEAIVGLAHRPTTAWIRNAHGASLAHGIEVCITIDEDRFVGSGLPLFARVLDRFFGLYVQINSFTELVVVSHNTGKEIVRCPPRNGDQYPA